MKSENDTIKLIESHRSIRKFTAEAIKPEVLEAILNSARAAATSSFQQVVSIIRITEQGKKVKLAELAGNQAYVATCAEFLVFCVDFYRNKQIMSEGDISYIEQLMTACVDAGLMAQNALLAAQSLQLGGVYIGAMRNHPNAVINLLHLPEGVFPLFGLCLGYPDQNPALKPRLPLEMLVHENKYQPFSQEQLAQYDAQVKTYYEQRTQARKSLSWSEVVQEKLSQEARPFMLDCLHKQGLAKK